jgi:hypothetical protein
LGARLRSDDVRVLQVVGKLRLHKICTSKNRSTNAHWPPCRRFEREKEVGRRLVQNSAERTRRMRDCREQAGNKQTPEPATLGMTGERRGPLATFRADPSGPIVRPPDPAKTFVHSVCGDLPGLPHVGLVFPALPYRLPNSAYLNGTEVKGNCLRATLWSEDTTRWKRGMVS